MRRGCLAMSASDAGRPQPHARHHAHPDATVAIGGTEIAVTATELAGQDRDAALQRFLGYPMYRAYRGRTNRELRLFALSRREE
jgi:hypothetical protein